MLSAAKTEAVNKYLPRGWRVHFIGLKPLYSKIIEPRRFGKSMESIPVGDAARLSDMEEFYWGEFEREEEHRVRMNRVMYDDPLTKGMRDLHYAKLLLGIPQNATQDQVKREEAKQLRDGKLSLPLRRHFEMRLGKSGVGEVLQTINKEGRRSPPEPMEIWLVRHRQIHAKAREIEAEEEVKFLQDPTLRPQPVQVSSEQFGPVKGYDFR